MAENSDIYRKVAVAWAVFFVPVYVSYLLGSSPPHDWFDGLIGRDFVSTWMGARSALADGPAKWFDFDAYNAALRAVFGATSVHYNWSYPPHLLLLTWPLGLLSYLPAYVVWSVAGLALFLMVATDDGRRGAWLPLLALSPAVAMNAVTGQIGFLTASLLIGGWKELDRRPVIAGICFGLLTVKPQLGILLPLMLMLTRRWTTILAALATVMATALVAAWLYGWNVWTEYFQVAMPFQRRVLVEGGGVSFWMIPTPFINVRLAQWPIEWAWAAQALVSMLAVAAVCWTFARRREAVLSTAVFVAASFLVTPYVFSYDLVALGWVIMLVRERSDNKSFDHGLAIAVWMLPMITLALGLAEIPGSCLVLVAFLLRLTWRLAVADAPAAHHDALPRADEVTLPSRAIAVASS
jgi:hypothetical protein